MGVEPIYYLTKSNPTNFNKLVSGRWFVRGDVAVRRSITMIHKSLSPLAGHVRVVFELPSCLWADRIFLVGDFNQWDNRATPMQQDRDGIWRAMIDLKRGEQAQFRYLIDGQWRTDYHADANTQNEFGSENSIVYATLPEELEAAMLLNDSVQESVHHEYAASAAARPAATRRLHLMRRARQPDRVAA